MGFIVLLFVVLLLVVLLVAGLLTTVITLVRKHQRRSTTPLVVEDRPDGWTVIHAHPAPLPSHVTLVPALVGMLVAFGVTMISGAKGSVVGLMAQWLVTWIVAGGVLMVWMQSLNNSKRHIQDQPFAVRAEAVRLPNGVEVAAGRIYAVTMRNGLDGHVTVMVTNSTIGALSSIGAAAHSRRLGNISYRIDLDHDGRSSTLAGGLTETQARAVAAEVIRRVRGLV